MKVSSEVGFVSHHVKDRARSATGCATSRLPLADGSVAGERPAGQRLTSRGARDSLSAPPRIYAHARDQDFWVGEKMSRPRWGAPTSAMSRNFACARPDCLAR